MSYRIKLLDYQMDLLLSKARYKGFIGGTGTGKTYFIPIYLLYKMAEDKGKEWIVSAPTYPMMKRTAWKYVKDGFDRYGIRYEENKADMVLETEDGIIYFISAETHERMQGIHASGIIGDEAGMYPREWWDTALQRVSFTGGEILLTTTPYSSNHWLKLDFFESWKRGDKDFFVVNPISIENPFYPVSEFERAKRRLPKWKFELFYLARFPDEKSNALFRYEDIVKCCELEEDSVNELVDNYDLVITIDVAREGNDESVLIEWVGFEMKSITKIEKNTLKELASVAVEKVKRMCEEYGVNEGDIYIVLDMTGLGAGLYEELYYDTGFEVIGVKFGERASDSDAYENVRAEMYFRMAKAVEDRKVRLLRDDDLISDLLVQEKRISTRGRFLLKSKEEIKKATGKSPDVSDAAALRFVDIHGRAGII